MADQVQRRRGTTAEHSTFTGAVGEWTQDTDKKTVVVHDGSTAGGFPLAHEPCATIAKLQAAPKYGTRYLSLSGRAGWFEWDSSDLSAQVALDTEQGLYIPPTSDATGASGAWVRQYTGAVRAEWFGAVGDGSTNNDDAIIGARNAIRQNGVSILDTVGGSTITAYESGVIEFGAGVFVMSPDVFEVRYDIGLTLRGQGSRGRTNYVRGRTVLLFSGTSSGYGIKCYRNGGRNFHVFDMDIAYATSGFTGDLIQVTDCPGVQLERCYVGTNGVTGGTRLTTAQSCVRPTYDEFLTLRDCTFDGAQYGVYDDATITELANTFGGSATTIENCVFYDFTQVYIYSDAARTREGLNLLNCVWNPIGVAPQRAVSVNNVDGYNEIGCKYAPSTSFPPAVEWAYIYNVTGNLHGNQYGDLAKAGTLYGTLDIRGNVVFCTDGFTLLGGVITSGGNEFGKSTTAWDLSPTVAALSWTADPDTFKASVTTSIDVPADDSLLSCCIRYSFENDASTNKFQNTSERVRIVANDEEMITQNTTPINIPATDSGRTHVATGGSAQVFNLPVPESGTDITVVGFAGVGLTVNAAGGTSFTAGGGTAYTSAAKTNATDVGCVLRFKSYGASSWIVTNEIGAWSYI